MFGSLGFTEIAFILILALLLFGPKRLPEIGRTLGKGLAEFRRASNELKRTLEVEVAEEERAAHRPAALAPATPMAPVSPIAPVAAAVAATPATAAAEVAPVVPEPSPAPSAPAAAETASPPAPSTLAGTEPR